MNKLIIVLLIMLIGLPNAGLQAHFIDSERGIAETMHGIAETTASPPQQDADGKPYRGEWRELPALGSWFCLPEGWHGQAYDALAEGVTAFNGGNGDDTVSFLVTQWDSAEGGEYTGQTGDAFLEYVAESIPRDEITLVNVNGTEVVLYRNNQGDRKSVLVPQLDQVVCFGFYCEAPDSLGDDLALAIAGSLCPQ